MYLKILLTALLISPASTYAKSEALRVFLKDDRSYRINISRHGTVLSFPEKPSHVSLSTHSGFNVTPTKNDLIVLATNSKASGRLFVYIQGKRNVLDLRASTRARPIIIFQHPKTQNFTPEFK